MADPYKDIHVGAGETVIEGVWFDSGADNYYDTNPSEGNHDIRPDEGVQTYDYLINNDYVGGRETDTPSCVAWINAGEWVQYTIQVDVAGKYQLSAWLASDTMEAGFIAYYDGTQIGEAICEPFDGWHDYTLYTVGSVDMTAGTHVIKVEFPDGGLNFESMVFDDAAAVAAIQAATTTEAPTTTAAPTTLAPATTVAAADTTAANSDAAASGTTASGDNSSGSNWIIWVIIAVVVVVVIVVIIILVTRKKK